MRAIDLNSSSMSLKEAIETVDRLGVGSRGYLNLERAIKIIIKTAKRFLSNPYPDWIPISEGTPKKQGWYICSIKDGRVNSLYWKNGHWIDNVRVNMFDLYNIYSKITGEKVEKKNCTEVFWDDWVFAWMPLPKPYGGK